LQNPEVRIVADPAVEPEGCIVESRWGIVDARLSEQLRAIWEQLQ
jgi:flagellar biosynthesis/type III secretory pathway protein FliH